MQERRRPAYWGNAPTAESGGPSTGLRRQPSNLSLCDRLFFGRGDPSSLACSILLAKSWSSTRRVISARISATRSCSSSARASDSASSSRSCTSVMSLRVISLSFAVRVLFADHTPSLFIDPVGRPPADSSIFSVRYTSRLFHLALLVGPGLPGLPGGSRPGPLSPGGAWSGWPV